MVQEVMISSQQRNVPEVAQVCTLRQPLYYLIPLPLLSQSLVMLAVISTPCWLVLTNFVPDCVLAQKPLVSHQWIK